MSGREKRKQVVKQTDVIVDRSDGKMSHLFDLQRAFNMLHASTSSLISEFIRKFSRSNMKWDSFDRMIVIIPTHIYLYEELTFSVAGR